jgi:di/tricarboxylate transporter
VLRKKHLLIVFVALAASGMLALPVAPDTPPNVLPTLAITVFTVGLWATGALAEYVTSLIFFVLAIGFAIAPPEVVFSGLASSAFWLVVGGMVIGIAADRTGLGRYLAHIFTRRMDASYPQLISGIIIGAVALAFLLPSSMGRLVILMPIILGLADNLGFEPGSKGRTGMALAGALGTFYVPLTILPANLPNVVLAGVADTLYGLPVNYGEYLLMHFPVTGVIKGMFLILFISYLFRSEMPVATKTKPAPELDADGRRLGIILAFALMAWATDFVHGVSPGWVSVCAAVFCLMPGIGVLKPKNLRGNTSYQTLIYVIAILGVGSVISTTGAGGFIATEVLKVIQFEPGQPAQTYAVFSGLSMAFSTFSTLPGMIAILAPFADQVATSSGQTVFVIIMMIVNGFSTLFLPYQSAPIMVGLRLGGVGLGTAARVMFPLAILTLILLQPLNYLWWQALGYLN